MENPLFTETFPWNGAPRQPAQLSPFSAWHGSLLAKRDIPCQAC
jgi:hypothetical protein